MEKDLMKPRYKVIADAPRLSYNIGRILTPVSEGSELFDCIEAPSSEKIWNPEKYPALFRKLEWWENRKKSEMPQYIKCISESANKGKVAMVEKWNMPKGSNKAEDTYASVNGYCWFVSGHVPATIEEYNNPKINRI